MTQAAKVPNDSASIWYLYIQESCHGPFSREQMIHLILTKQVDAETLTMKGGEDQWRPIMDCLNEISESEDSKKSREPHLAERRIAAPRIGITGTIKFKNKAKTADGNDGDISVTGMFVGTMDTSFKIGEVVELTVDCPQLKKPFQAAAEVVRHNANSKYPVGYGLRFVRIGNEVIGKISTLIGYRPISEFGEFFKRVDLEVVGTNLNEIPAEGGAEFSKSELSQSGK